MHFQNATQPTTMIYIEPLDLDFLETKNTKFVCRVPPHYTLIRLDNMKYLTPVDTYLTLEYQYPCQIVAQGEYINDKAKDTVSKVFYLVKLAEKNLYYLMTEEEEKRHIVKKMRKLIETAWI